MLLIITSKSDLAADYLIAELSERALPYFRLNAEDLGSAGYSFAMDAKAVHRCVRVGPRSLNLKEVTAVWYRRAMQPVPPADLEPGERSFVAGELRHLATGLVLGEGPLWVNPIEAVQVAEHKILQLRVAHELGFTVPPSLVSNDKAILQRFIADKQRVICKPIYHGLFFDGERRFAVYTRRVSAEELDDESTLACPVLLQQEIPRKADVRATFIGETCFVAEIDNMNNDEVDWRKPGQALQYSPSSLPPDVEHRCRTMMSGLRLRYGAFDFVRTPDDDFAFLEVNPTGEWAWLEEELGFEMRQAFIRLFYGGEV